MKGIEWRAYEVGHCMHPACSTRQGDTWRRAKYPALAFLLRHPKLGCILFDTGYAKHFFDATRRFPERLYRLVAPPHLAPGESLVEQLAHDGVAASDITSVIVSHMHGDHVAGLPDFPAADIICSRDAWHDLHMRGRFDTVRHGLLPALVPETRCGSVRWMEDIPRVALSGTFADLGYAYDLFGDQSMLAVPLPGHAAGQHGLLFDGVEGRPVLLLADAVWSSRTLLDGVPPPRLVTGLLGHTHAYRATLERLVALHRAHDELLMVPSHCRQWRAA